MKHILTSSKGLVALLLVFGMSVSSQARMRYFVDDFFADDFFADAFEDHFERMQDQMKAIRKRAASFGPSKEEREALRAARENLSKIKAKIDSDEQNVYIRFNVDGVTKDDVKIVKKSNGFLGTIPAKGGQVEFFVSPHYLEIARHIELKKEKKDSKDNKKEDQEDKGQEKQAVYYYSTSATEVTSLPHTVDLSSAQANTKDTTLTITIAKKKEAVLPITHG